MGIDGGGSSWVAHFISIAVGFFGGQFYPRESHLEYIIEKAISHAVDTTNLHCAEACAPKDCQVPEPSEPTIQLDWSWEWIFKLALWVIGGFVPFICSICCLRRGVSLSREVESPGDRSPQSLEDRRNLAQLQLAEVRARRRNGTP